MIVNIYLPKYFKIKYTHASLKFMKLASESKCAYPSYPQLKCGVSSVIEAEKGKWTLCTENTVHQTDLRAGERHDVPG